MSRPSIKGTTQKPNIRALPEPQQGSQRIPGAPVSTEPLLTLGPWSQMVLTPQTPRKACNLKEELDPHPSQPRRMAEDEV